MKQASFAQAKLVQIPESPLLRFLFSDTRMAWLWLVVRVYIGWDFLMAGWGKVTSAAWVGPNAGGAIKGFLMGALQKTAAATGNVHPDVQSWYASFIQNYALPNAFVLSHMVAFGEVLVGVALILGIFVGIAAFFGAFMSINFLLAGTVSVNPILVTLCVLLMLSWRTAGWYGLGYYAVPYLGTYWQRGKLFR